MQSMRFLVLLHWQSGRRTAYCAAAYDAETAVIAAQSVTQGDLAEIVSTEALAWPPELGGPKAPRNAGAAYKLRSRDFVDRTLGAILASAPEAPALDYCELCGATDEHTDDCPTLPAELPAGHGPGRPGHVGLAA